MSPVAFLIAVPLSIYALLRNPRVLYFVWPLLAVPFSSARLNAGPLPIVLIDIWTFLLLVHLARRGPGPLLRIPGNMNWHWLLLLATLPGALTGMLEFGAAIEVTYETARYGLMWFMIPVGAWLAGANHLDRERRALGIGMVVALFITAGMLLYEASSAERSIRLQQFLFGRAEELKFALKSTRGSGPFHGPNAMGGAGLLMGGVTWLMLARDRAALAGIGVGLALFCSGFTLARHALAAFAIGAPFALVGSTSVRGGLRRSFIRAGVFAVLFTVVFVAFGDAWVDRIEERGSLVEDENVLARVVVGPQKLFETWADHPRWLLTGIGLGLNKARFIRDADTVKYLGFASNGFLLAFLYQGALGFLAFFSMFVTAAVRSLASRRHIGTQGFAIIVVTAGVFTADNYGYRAKQAVALWAMIIGATLGHAVWSRYNDIAGASRAAPDPEPEPEPESRGAAVASAARLSSE